MNTTKDDKGGTGTFHELARVALKTLAVNSRRVVWNKRSLSRKILPMLSEPTPRMIIAQLNEVEKEKNRAHDAGVNEILSGGHGEEHFSERDRLKEDMQSLREHIRNNR